MGRLFWKFFLAFWLALLIAGIAVGTGVWFHKRSLDEAGDDLVMGPAAALMVRAASATLAHGGLPALRDWLATAGEDPRLRLYAVNDEGRDLLGRNYAAVALERARRLAEAPTGRPAAAYLLDGTGTRYLLFVAEAGMGTPAGTPPPWLPILAGLLASLGFSALLAWYLAKPIRVLRSAFDAASAGDLDVRVAPGMGGRRDELADLGRDFDHMAGRLRDLMDIQRRLLHDVSHEIRSPLARLHAAIDLARQQPERLEISLDRIEREGARLDEMVGELLTLSRLEAGMADTRRERMDLADLVGMVVEDARFEAEVQGRRVEFAAPVPAPVRCGAELLHRAVENVVRNALRFSPPGGVIDIRVEQAGPGRVAVVVRDGGPGVPAAHLEAIFDPFYRVENGQGGAGFGLGLALARRAVEAHGGVIRAANRPGGGLEVHIELPTDSAAEERRTPA